MYCTTSLDFRENHLLSHTLILIDWHQKLINNKDVELGLK